MSTHDIMHLLSAQQDVPPLDGVDSETGESEEQSEWEETDESDDQNRRSDSAVGIVRCRQSLSPLEHCLHGAT